MFTENGIKEAEEKALAEDKRKGRGRRRYNQISRKGSPVRLLNRCQIHIEKMVRDLKHVDPNFANETAAVRHYVNVGIAAETATSDLRRSLDNTIVKKSIKTAAHDEITVLKKDLEKAVDLLKDLSKRQTEDFADIARRTELIETKVERVLESSETNPKTQATPEAAKQQTALKDARQRVILKCLFNAFYVAQRLDQIPAVEGDYMIWANLLNKETHAKVSALPTKELMAYANNAIPAEQLRAFAKQIFNQVALNLRKS